MMNRNMDTKFVFIEFFVILLLFSVLVLGYLRHKTPQNALFYKLLYLETPNALGSRSRIETCLVLVQILFLKQAYERFYYEEITLSRKKLPRTWDSNDRLS